MAIPVKWAIQRIFDISIFDLETGKNLGYLVDLKQANFTQDGTTVYAQGGAGNPKLVGFDHSKMATMECQSALFENGFIGTVVGATPVVAASTDVLLPDILTVASNAAVTTYTALGTAGAEIKYAYVQNTDGTLGEVLTQDSIVGSGTFTYTPGTKTITFDAGELANGAVVVVFYNVTTAADTITFTSYTDLFSKSVKMVASTLVRDLCDNLDYAAQLIFEKGKLSNTFSLEVTADGEPAIHNFSIEALKPCDSTELWKFVMYDSSTVV